MGTRFCFPSDVVTPLATISIALGTLSVDSNYREDNLKGIDPSKPCWFTDNAADIVYDFGAPQRLDGICIPSHTLDENLDVRFQGNAANGWVAPTLNAQIPIGARDRDGHSKCAWKDLTGVAGYSTQGFQYWRLHIPTNSVPVKLTCTPLITQWRSFTGHVLADLTRAIRRPYDIVMETEFGVKTIFDKPVKIRGIVGNVLGTDADVALMLDLLDDCDTGATPFVFILDDTVLADGGLYVRPSDDLLTNWQINWKAPDINPFQISFEEVSRGLPL